VLLGVEARLAKTDAVLGALCVGAMGFIARAYLASKAPGIAPGLNRNHLILFWLVIGASVLIKGPITAAIVALTLVVLAVRDRSLRWFGGMKPGMGLAIVLAVAAPWFAMILMKSGWSFIEESLMKDMFAKVGSAQEKHGAPPGTYLGVFWITFWPAAPLAILAAAFAWRERRDDGVAFLIAWIVPFWLILEAVPTKLPHYVLPLYPAIAILIVLAMERSGLMLRRWALWLAAILFLLVPTVFLIGTPALFLLLDEGAMPLRLPFFALPFIVVAFGLGVYGAREMIQARPIRMLGAGVLASLTLAIGAYNFGLPMLKAFNLSPRLAAAAAATGCANPVYATVGYREPSLVFKTDTEILMAKPEEAAAFIDAPGVGCRIAFIERRFEDEFRAALKGQSAPAVATRVRGVNINAAVDRNRRLRVLDIAVYVRR
jgi:4-amino-4-deoxy-L-arabinose transferase-like glycosyltransferase